MYICIMYMCVDILSIDLYMYVSSNYIMLYLL